MAKSSKDTDHQNYQPPPTGTTSPNREDHSAYNNPGPSAQRDDAKPFAPPDRKK